jgi:hypothetical protein
MNYFNEHGKPNSEIDDFAFEVETLVRNFLHTMADNGCSGVELRAATGYISSCADLAGSHAIFYLSDKLRREKIAAADLNLTDEEASMLHEDVKNKVPVIKLYRERTGLGLKESKDAIEAWFNKNEG